MIANDSTSRGIPTSILTLNEVDLSDKRLPKEHSEYDSGHNTNTEHGRSFCPVCERSFVQKSTMRRHLKIHMGGPSFLCAICNRRFSRNDTLIRHLRVCHTDST